MQHFILWLSYKVRYGGQGNMKCVEKGEKSLLYRLGC